MPYLVQTTNFVVSHLSWDLAKFNINATQCVTAADSVLGNHGAASGEKNSKLKLISVQHHFLIISCSYALNPAPAGFAIINQAKSGCGRICKNQIRYSPSLHWYSCVFIKLKLWFQFTFVVVICVAGCSADGGVQGIADDGGRQYGRNSSSLLLTLDFKHCVTLTLDYPLKTAW